ncbi:MAG: large subunit ribosomal protein L20 [Acidimicrobiales bacterium]|jgi:large subunit ribosomal protein L20
MARVKGGTTPNKRRKNILAQTKGYRFGRSNKLREAREAIYHAQLHSFDHRKKKKGDFRRLWTTRINAALRLHDMKYSRFIKALSDKNIKIDRKILSQLALERPEQFTKVVEATK